MHVGLLFGEPDHSVQSILNRELWSTVDKTTHRHSTNHHKMSVSLNLLLHYKINLFLVFKSTAQEMPK